MTKTGSVLLVSTNPELHRTLHLITSTYNFKLVGTEDPKKGVSILKSNAPNCIIFDLESLRDPRHKNIAKKRLDESGVPTLLLNDNDNGVSHAQHARTPIKLEPLVKFIMDNCNGVQRGSNGGFMGRMLSLLKFKRT